MPPSSLSSTATLRALFSERLSRFDVQLKNAEKQAAVALIITDAGFGADLPDLVTHQTWQTSPAIVLTRRSPRLNSHAGQWALPGGKVDAGESAFQAAVRESSEEIYLTLNENDCLGRLDDYVTRSGYAMSPFVFWPDNTEAMQPNPDEVASIHRIPVDELLRDDAPLLDHAELDVSDRLGSGDNPVLRMPLGESWIAAPTAAVLYQFREVCLRDKATRVAHFEQPRFTWT